MQVGETGFLLGGLVRGPEHVCLDGAGKDGVDPDILRAVFGGEDLRQTNEPGFARRISRDTGKTDGVADECAREDDRALSLLQHGGDLMLGSEERTRQIDLERFVPAVERNPRGRPLLAEYAGVVEGDVEASVALLGTIHQRLRERLLADVTRQRERAASLVGNFADEHIQLLLATSAHNHLRAGARKQLCGRPSDTGAGTCYDRHFAFQINHRFPQYGSVRYANAETKAAAGSLPRHRASVLLPIAGIVVRLFECIIMEMRVE